MNHIHLRRLCFWFSLCFVCVLQTKAWFNWIKKMEHFNGKLNENEAIAWLTLYLSSGALLTPLCLYFHTLYRGSRKFSSLFSVFSMPLSVAFLIGKIYKMGHSFKMNELIFISFVCIVNIQKKSCTKIINSKIN